MANFHFYYFGKENLLKSPKNYYFGKGNIYGIPVENNLYNSLKNYCFKNGGEPPS